MTRVTKFLEPLLDLHCKSYLKVVVEPEVDDGGHFLQRQTYLQTLLHLRFLSSLWRLAICLFGLLDSRDENSNLTWFAFIYRRALMTQVMKSSHPMTGRSTHFIKLTSLLSRHCWSGTSLQTSFTVTHTHFFLPTLLHGVVAWGCIQQVSIKIESDMPLFEVSH